MYPRCRFGRRREVPVIADAPSTIGTDYQRLRRLPWAAAATVAKSGTVAADSGSLAPVRLSAAENIYMAWFILFSGRLTLGIGCVVCTHQCHPILIVSVT